MKLLSLEINSKFRSLDKGFKIQFHQQDNLEAMLEFNPFCLVGLNGCGKSNVLEALSEIFYHVELCVGLHLPSILHDENVFISQVCAVNAFKLQYMTSDSPQNEITREHTVIVTISKEVNESPKITVRSQGVAPMLSFDLGKFHVSQSSLVKSFLPQYIVAYSSGENETLSIPYIKSRFIHLHEFKENIVNDVVDYSSPENSLIYVDANMSQAILLSCLLFEKANALKSLADYDNTGILGIKRFRMRLRKEVFVDERGAKFSYFALFERKRQTINGIMGKELFEILSNVSSISWYDEKIHAYYFDFWVNEATKQAFRSYFHTAIECFQVFRLLYELNNYAVTMEKQKEIFESRGVYTEGKFGTPGADNDIFHFLDFFLVKQMNRQGKQEDLLLRQFSDGEHQFIHMMAICLLLKNADSLLILDEPETHFNPSWRSRFVSILNETLKNACEGNEHNFKKDILITTHSPFIISDCKPENVIILRKDKEGQTLAKKASQESIMTYGASTSFIQAKIFGNKDAIGGKAYQEMKKMSEQTDMDKQQLLNDVSTLFGESLEKLMILGKINNRE